MFETMIEKKAKWGDIMRSCHQIENDLYQVAPYKSMVRNWGNDGSGLHCGDDNGKMHMQEIILESTFSLNEQNICNSIPWHITFWEHLPSDKLSRFKVIVRLFFKKIFQL